MPSTGRLLERIKSNVLNGYENVLEAARKHRLQVVGGQTLRFSFARMFAKQFNFHLQPEPTHAPIESDPTAAEESRWDDDGGQGHR